MNLNDVHSARERLRTAMEGGGAHVGDLAWPEVRVAGSALERDQLRSWLAEAGLPEAWAPADPSGQKAFGKALAFVRNLEAAPGVSIEREQPRSRVALVRHHTGRGLEKETRTWARVSVSELEELEVEWSAAQDVQDALSRAVSSTVHRHISNAIEALRAEFDRLISYTDAAEVGEMAVQVLTQLGAVRVRRDGGLYFVPPGEAQRLRAFAEVMAKVGDSALPFIPAFDTPDSRASLGRSMNETLQGEVSAIVRGLSKLKTEGGRESSLHRRLEDLESLTLRAQACSVVLESYSDDIALAVAGARAQVLALLEVDEPLSDDDALDEVVNGDS